MVMIIAVRSEVMIVVVVIIIPAFGIGIRNLMP